jgi:hypothetical protein
MVGSRQEKGRPEARAAKARLRALSAWVALGLMLSGCTGGEEAAITVAELPSLVLQPEDVSAEFVRFDEGRQTRADLRPGPRRDADRFGRVAGWKARYRTPGSEETEGPLVVVSMVDLFEEEEGARRDLEAHEAELETQGELVEVPKVGEESRAMTILQESQLADVRFYAIVWRRENVTASVLVQGFEGKIELADALGLARKQDGRIARATA